MRMTLDPKSLHHRLNVGLECSAVGTLVATAPLWLIRKSLTSDGCVTKAIYEFSTHAGYSAGTPQVHLHGHSFVSLIELFQREIVLFTSTVIGLLCGFRLISHIVT